jgi:hypothetical protein
MEVTVDNPLYGELLPPELQVRNKYIKPALFVRFISKRSFYQERLGGKTVFVSH